MGLGVCFSDNIGRLGAHHSPAASGLGRDQSDTYSNLPLFDSFLSSAVDDVRPISSTDVSLGKPASVEAPLQDFLHDSIKNDVSVASPFFQRGSYFHAEWSRISRPCGFDCKGNHFLSGCRIQLNPCVFFDECFRLFEETDCNADYIFSGVRDGFAIVDSTFEVSYFCENYDSISKLEFKVQMDKTIESELDQGKVSLVDSRPTCVHALGAISKQVRWFAEANYRL